MKKEKNPESLRKQSSFLAYMSHEIRTPLNVIIGVTDMLSEGGFNPIEEVKLVNLLRNAEEHLMTIIDNILDFSKLESGTVEVAKDDFVLNELIEKTHAMLNMKASLKGISLSYEIAPDLPLNLIGDPNKLRQILINLVGNAIKFTHAGHVKICISKVKSKEQHPQNDEITVLFEVIDTGIGIAQDKIDKLFTDYMQVDSSITSKYGGTGLGLAISKKLVDLMGGDIAVESEAGKGSQFYFTIRFKRGTILSPADAMHNAKMQEFQEGSKVSGTHNILLVDDSEDNRMMTQMYLQQFPYKLDMAENGLIAVTKVKKTRYDLILMDIEMPVMDGYTATKKIREWEKVNSLPQTPILALSANAFEENIRDGIKEGCTSYLTKPIKKAVLIDAIEKHISKIQ